jgi:hypothetical protein
MKTTLSIAVFVGFRMPVTFHASECAWLVPP